MKIQEVLEKTATFFRTKQMDSPRLDAELLIAASLGIQRIDLYLKFDQPLKEEELEKCRDFVRRRSTGEPVAYILNLKHFYGNEFYVDKRVLIPRPETELLVEMAIEEIKKIEEPKKNDGLKEIPGEVQILDLGAGSGAIGLSILKRMPEVTATLVEADLGAVEVIQLNSDKLGVTNRANVVTSRVQDFTVSDQFNLVLANPPYIDRQDTNVELNVKKFEPEVALFADDQGLAEIKSWLPVAVRHCAPGGLVIFEMGWQQGKQVAEFFAANGFKDVLVHKDLAALDRFVSGRKGNSHG